MSRLDEMVRGYLLGFEGGALELPECYAQKSPAFKHGWHNGRDDRLGAPRERAPVLRRRALMILEPPQ